MLRALHALCRDITPDEVATFKTNGVVKLQGVLDRDTINTLRRDIDTAVATLPESNGGYDMTQLCQAFESSDMDVFDSYGDGQHNIGAMLEFMQLSGKPLLRDEVAGKPGKFKLDTNVTRRITSLRRFATKGAPAEIASALMGGEETRFFGDQIFVKEPNTAERTAFHQDASYFEIDGDQCCVLWVPVDPITADLNGMQYVRGSHLDRTIYRPNMFVTQTTYPGARGPVLPDIEGNSDAFDIVSFDVEPGDIVVHHYRTIHGARGNAHPYQVRRALSIRYCGDDIRWVDRPWTNPPTYQQRPRAGEPLSGADFPVVWARARQNEAA